jgi:hypothetical protein
MRQIKLHAFLGVLCLFGSISSRSQTDPVNVVTSAVPFLRISPDARAGGMGDLGVATSPDVNSQFYNIGKYPFASNRSGVGVTYTPWLKDLGLNDVFLATVAGYYKLDDEQAISTSMRYFSLGNIQFTDNFGNDLQMVTPWEFSIDAGYSRKLSDRLGLGVAMRYIYSNLAGNAAVNGISYKPGTAVAGDVGLYYSNQSELGDGLSLGLALTNLGSKIGYTDDVNARDFIPANLTLGGVYTRVVNEVNKVSFGLDIHKLMVPTPPSLGDSAGLASYRSKGVVGSWFSSFGDAPGGFGEELREFYFSLGAEYVYNDLFSVRAGYFHEDKTKGNRQYFSIGTGIKWSTFTLNFSYLIPSGAGVNRNPLSNTLRFGLIFDFGQSAPAMMNDFR